MYAAPGGARPISRRSAAHDADVDRGSGTGMRQEPRMLLSFLPSPKGRSGPLSRYCHGHRTRQAARVPCAGDVSATDAQLSLPHAVRTSGLGNLELVHSDSLLDIFPYLIMLAPTTDGVVAHEQLCVARN